MFAAVRIRGLRLAMAVVALTGTAVVGGSLAAPTAAGAATSTHTFRVLTWNVDGPSWSTTKTAHSHGGNGDLTTNRDLENSITHWVTYHQADFVSIEALCWHQYKNVQADLVGKGWVGRSASFARFSVDSKNACHEDHNPKGRAEAFGTAIFSRFGFSTAYRPVALPQPKHGPGDNQIEHVLCDKAAGHYTRVVFCGVHIRPSELPVVKAGCTTRCYTRMKQVDTTFATARKFRSGNTVLLAGDFNTGPSYYSRTIKYPRSTGHDALDAYYATSVNSIAKNTVNRRNSGSWDEVDERDSRCPGYGEGTQVYDINPNPCYRKKPAVVETRSTPVAQGHGEKIDYIWVAHADVVAGKALPHGFTGDSQTLARNECPHSSTPSRTCSDHMILYGSVNLRYNRR